MNEARLDGPCQLRLLGTILSWRIALYSFGEMLELHGHILVGLALIDPLALPGRLRSARLSPGVHLRQQKVEALSRVCLVIQDELAAQVIQFKELDSNFVAVRAKHRLLALRILIVLNLLEEALQ